MALKNNKSLGQHWLKDRQVLDDIADFAEKGVQAGPASPFPPADFAQGEAPGGAPKASHPSVNLCLEIGPGLGTLTSSLLKRFEKVIAVEFDERLANNLPKSFPGKNLEVINADFLSFDLSKIKEPYIIAGNIPYYITSPIITKLLEAENKPERIVLLIQKEVAERIAAEDGKNSVISLTSENLSNVTLGPIVPRDMFTPPPKVDSEIIIFEPHPAIVSEDVIKLIKRGFSSPRKKLIKNVNQDQEKLKSVFNELGISDDARPADLSLEEWARLQKILTTTF